MKAGLGRIGRALRHRNYRLFFGGQSVSLVGTWVTRLATSWMVYRLTGSGLLLGLVSLANQLPASIFAPLAGVWVDRWDRRRVLVITQILACLQSVALAALTFAGHMTVGWLLALGVVQGLINAFDTPARQAFLLELLTDRKDLPNAIALNSSMIHAARLVGPSIAGLLIAAVGEGWCFAVDALSYLAVIASLVAIRVPPRKPHPRTGHMFRELAEGLRATGSIPMVKGALIMVCLACLLGGPYTVLMPMLAVDRFGGGADLLGFLTGAAGLGALCAALYLAQRQSVVGLGGIMARAAIAFGLALVTLAWVPSVWLALPLVFVAAACLMLLMAAANTIVQSLVDEDKRGRVLGFYTLAVFGFMPIGGLLEGAAANRLGVSLTITVGGAACVVAGLLFLRVLPALRRASRPRYEALGLIPPG